MSPPHFLYATGDGDADRGPCGRLYSGGRLRGLFPAFHPAAPREAFEGRRIGAAAPLSTVLEPPRPRGKNKIEPVSGKGRQDHAYIRLRSLLAGHGL